MGIRFHSSQVLYEEFLVLSVVTQVFNHYTQRLRQVDLYGFLVSFVYLVSPSLAKTT